MTDRDDVVLEANNVTRHFPVRQGTLRRDRAQLRAVDGVTIELHRGRTLGIVGESGCGKSTLARLLAGLDQPTSGKVRFGGATLADLDRKSRRAVRRRLQFVFQDPYESLNPRFTVRQIVGEPWRYHRDLADGIPDRTARIGDLLELVGLASRHLDRYPAQLSGGERQRVGIARALALEPEVLLLDEPVSALDVSVQAQVLNLLIELRRTLNLSLLVVTHDLSVVRYLAEEVAVMYLGKIVERGTTDAIWNAPHHPYTRMLMSSTPGQGIFTPKRADIPHIAGELPSPISPPSGCNFRTRCWLATDHCATTEPELVMRANGHLAACHFADRVAALRDPRIEPSTDPGST